jgi:hypothetical protein
MKLFHINHIFMKKLLSLMLLMIGAATPVVASAADTPTTVQNFAQASLLGVQLAIKHAHQNGKVSTATANCVAALKPGAFAGVYEQLLKSELTEEEQVATETFFKSATGAKYAKLGFLQVYQAVGEQAPEALPEFSSAEIAEVESFGRTPAGDKLIRRKALEQPAVMAPINQRIKELIAACPSG